MKKILFCLTALTAVGTLVWGYSVVNAQAPAPTGAAPAPAAAAPQPARPRIALVNIAKVLREYNKANFDGQNITKKRQEYVDKARPLSERLAKLQKDAQMMSNPIEKEKLINEGKTINRQLEDIQQEMQSVLTAQTDHTIVEVYQNIKAVINDIAVTNNLDLVMVYPDSSTPEEDKKPTVAQLKLQTPALIPMYHRNMDITEVVIVTLNRRHPAPPVVTNTPAPTPNIVPVGGKQ